MPESIYLPPFSINQWLRIVISKRQNSSGTLIPLCSTEWYFSIDVATTTTPIEEKKATKMRRHLQEILGLHTNLTEPSWIPWRGNKTIQRNDLISHYWFQRIANFAVSSEEAEMHKGQPGWCNFCVLKISQLQEHKGSLKRKHRGKHLWPETNTVLAQRGKRYCSKPITTQIVEFRFPKKTISQPFRNDIAGKISSQ